MKFPHEALLFESSRSSTAADAHRSQANGGGSAVWKSHRKIVEAKNKLQHK